MLTNFLKIRPAQRGFMTVVDTKIPPLYSDVPRVQREETKEITEE